MSSGRQLLLGFKKRWSVMQAIEIVLYALGPALLIYFLTRDLVWVVFTFMAVGLVLLLFRKPWKLTLEQIGQHLDNNLETTEYSTGLLLLPNEELSNLARLQQRKVRQVLEGSIHSVRPNVPLKRAFIVLGAFGLLALLANQYGGLFRSSNPVPPEADQQISFTPLDSTEIKHTPPKLVSQKLIIQYPAYTKIAPISTSNMNVKALEGSRLKWQLQFDVAPTEVILEASEAAHIMHRKDNGYEYQMPVTTSGFYNFRFEARDSTSHQSPLYALELFEDESPVIEIRRLKQFTTFEFDDDKAIEFESVVTDDFGITDAYIIATVSRGEGESVKFREERLPFEEVLEQGHKTLQLSKKLNLDKLGMVPGDELYFYISAVDAKEPKPNTARSETYFAVIRDTVTNQFAVEGTMGADLMPDYFRSQRQLIIDTEKLIADKNNISQNNFNSTSNELGFDQKALRLRYGEFMGDEAEAGIAVAEEVTMEEIQDDGENDSEDPLSTYTHDHDGSNEHNLVDHDHHEHEEHGEEHGDEDPLESYLHNHDDPEESTLFTQSLKRKLRQAMTEMWDAELYLRLYTPEKSLPYQYRALKLIQEIKNSARIYVHRIGFDPPPIKEDKRLTGELDEIVNFQKKENLAVEDDLTFLRKAAERLEQLITKNDYMASDKTLFTEAGSELAQLAIDEPGKYLDTLQKLKWLSDSGNQWSKNELRQILKGVLAAIPKPSAKPSKREGPVSDLNKLFLQELEIND